MKKNMSRMLAFVLVLVLGLSTALTALASYDTIPYGERSDRVRKMQDKLKEKGYYPGSVDGKFGPATKSAVRKFQTSVGITVDGRPGNKTLTALYEGRSAINKANNTIQKQQTTPTNPNALYYGCTGSRVKSLQSALRRAGCYGGTLDGVYGDLTYDAVRKYQSKVGLHVDGIAGTKTLASLRKKTGTNISYGFTLDIGSATKEVKNVGRYLGYLGYDAPVVDTYNHDLAEAVKLWQAATGRKVTGVVTQKEYNDLVLNKDAKK